MKGTPTIDVCIPAIGSGVRYLDFLIRNLLALADDPDRIRLLISHHTPEDRAQLGAVDLHGRGAEWVHVPVPPPKSMFYPSANHSKAINALVARSSADVCLFADFDVAFLVPGWDRILCDHLLGGGVDLLGMAYAEVATGIPRKLMVGEPPIPKMFAWLIDGIAIKYQNLPTLTFLAIPRRILDRAFPDSVITRFDRFLDDGGLPFRLINTIQLSKETNLTMGSVQWLDTGYELTEVIAAHCLRCVAMPMLPPTTTEVFKSRLAFGPLAHHHQPEVYELDGAPFLAHFRKGWMKSVETARLDRFALFTRDIEAYVAGRARDPMTSAIPVLAGTAD